MDISSVWTRWWPLHRLLYVLLFLVLTPTPADAHRPFCIPELPTGWWYWPSEMVESCHRANYGLDLNRKHAHSGDPAQLQFGYSLDDFNAMIAYSFEYNQLVRIRLTYYLTEPGVDMFLEELGAAWGPPSGSLVLTSADIQALYPTGTELGGFRGTCHYFQVEGQDITVYGIDDEPGVSYGELVLVVEAPAKR